MAQSPSFLGFKADYCAFATATVSSFAALAIGVYFKPKGCAGVLANLVKKHRIGAEFLLVRFYNFM